MKLADTGNEYEAREQSGDFALLIGGVGANPEKARTIRDEIIRRVNAHDDYVKALEACRELFEKALPKFNWGSSFLNAEAIKLLNDVPIQVNAALALAEKGDTQQ